MLKLLSEIGPLIAFFAGFFYGCGIQHATLYMLITTVIFITLCYVIDKKVSKLFYYFYDCFISFGKHYF